MLSLSNLALHSLHTAVCPVSLLYQTPEAKYRYHASVKHPQHLWSVGCHSRQCHPSCSLKLDLCGSS
jgi:hypothetical protein